MYKSILNDGEVVVIGTTSKPREPAGNQVMKATLTDVQKAIEQLDCHNGGNSTATDFDLSDIDPNSGGGGEGREGEEERMTLKGEIKELG